MGEIARRVERIVGQHEKLDLPLLELLNKAVGSRNRAATADQDSIHVDQIVLGFPLPLLRLFCHLHISFTSRP